MSKELIKSLKEQLEMVIKENQRLLEKHFEQDSKIVYLTADYNRYKEENKELNNIIKEVREKVDNFDVFKEFTFPLMKRDEEQQVKSSIDYEWRESLKKPILEILDKVEEK